MTEWQTKKLGDLAEVLRGSTITRKEVTPGEVPVIAGGQTPSCYHNVSNRDGNTITVSASGAYAGFVQYFEIPIFASDCSTIKVKDENQTSSKFLFYMLQASQTEIYAFQRGSGQPHVYPSQLVGLDIPTPPIDEQRKIVELLEDYFSRLDAAVADIERSVTLNRSLQAATLEQLVKPQPSWTPMTLDSIAIKIKNGIFISRASAIKSGVPILRISALRPMKIDFTDLRYTNLRQDDAALKDNIIKSGDVLFTRYNGNSELVGACAVVPEMEEPITHPDKLIRVQLNRKLVDPFWLVMQCSGGVTRKLIRAKVKTTSGQAGISGTDLKTLTLNLPPLNVQSERARIYQSFLDDKRRLDSELQTLIASSAALKRSLLESAFSGKLTKEVVIV